MQRMGHDGMAHGKITHTCTLEIKKKKNEMFVKLVFGWVDSVGFGIFPVLPIPKHQTPAK